MNVLSVFYSKKLQIPILFLLIVLFLYSLYQRIPDIDDAWIGEYAYWLAEDGYVHSELMRGVNKQEVDFVVHHKLFNLNGALFIKLFDFSLYSLKAVSLVYFIVFIIMFYFYTHKWRRLFSKSDFVLAVIILLSFPWTFKYAFLYRPEIMMMTFGFIGFLLLEKSIINEKKTYWLHFISGMFFGLTAAAHLNGIILILSAGLLLLINKKYKDVIVFGMGVLITFSIYFYDLTTLNSFALWKHQFFDSPSLDSLQDGSPWFKPVINLFKEHMRYFHNLKIIAFSLFLIPTLIVGSAYLMRNHKLLVQFAALVAIITGVVAMHKSRQYILLNLPYLILLITLTLKALHEKKITNFKFGNAKQIIGLISFLFLLFFTVSNFFNIELASQKFTPEINRKISLKYAGDNEVNMKIVAPMSFIFNEIEVYDQIQGELCYTELQKLDTTIYGEGFLKRAYNFKRDLLIITPLFQNKLGIAHYEKGDDFEHYVVADKTEEFIVFRLKQQSLLSD